MCAVNWVRIHGKDRHVCATQHTCSSAGCVRLKADAGDLSCDKLGIAFKFFRSSQAAMPELPEVETIVCGLRARVLGRRISSVALRRNDILLSPPEDFVAALASRTIVDVFRHGKYIIIELDQSHARRARKFLLIHLGMTGQLILADKHQAEPRHTHLVLAFEDGRSLPRMDRAELRYTDFRRFGRLALLDEDQLPSALALLGPDPLAIRPRDFVERLRKRRATIKAALLNQRVLRGLGNIYADESLFRAQIHPGRRAHRLKREELIRLHGAIGRVLRAAIARQGSTVSNYVNLAGESGSFQKWHKVYRRRGQPCPRCGMKIVRVVVTGRGSYCCPRCQRGRAPRPRIHSMNIRANGRSPLRVS